MQLKMQQCRQYILFSTFKLWWFLGTIKIRGCFFKNVTLIRRIRISKKQMAWSKNKPISNLNIERENLQVEWNGHCECCGYLWSFGFEMMNLFQCHSAEFWRNALGDPLCWTKTASLRTGALICMCTNTLQHLLNHLVAALLKSLQILVLVQFLKCLPAYTT